LHRGEVRTQLLGEAGQGHVDDAHVQGGHEHHHVHPDHAQKRVLRRLRGGRGEGSGLARGDLWRAGHGESVSTRDAAQPPAGLFSGQGNFVLELRALWIGIEIEIVIEIDFWQCSDFDSDFDFDELCPTLGVPREQPPTYRAEIMKIF
jgi:hypothetical protein